MGEGWTARDIPDCLYPTDNEYDIPLLRLDLQARGVDLPLVIWGSRKRSARMAGTWAFYCDDYRFTGLWHKPYLLLNTGAAAVIEPNFTLHDQTPRARALEAVYRKRWLARTWQELAGVRVWVDLNVGDRHADINLLGVPKGWRAFATRGYGEQLADLDLEYALAARWAAGIEPLFLVYGGGTRVRDRCRERGWIWVPETMDSREDRVRPIAAGVVPGGAIVNPEATALLTTGGSP